MACRRVTGLVIAAALAAGFAAGAAAQGKTVFDLRSPAYPEFSGLAKKNVGNDPRYAGCDCGNISPPLAWTGAPAATKSYTLMVIDLAGDPPRGFVHWIDYGIPAAVTALAEGEGSKSSTAIVSGRNSVGKEGYFGPCPPARDKAHPYVFLLMATNLAPDALKSGLTREALAATLRGHVLGRTTLVLTYGQ